MQPQGCHMLEPWNRPLDSRRQQESPPASKICQAFSSNVMYCTQSKKKGTLDRILHHTHTWVPCRLLHSFYYVYQVANNLFKLGYDLCIFNRRLLILPSDYSKVGFNGTKSSKLLYAMASSSKIQNCTDISSSFSFEWAGIQKRMVRLLNSYS